MRGRVSWAAIDIEVWRPPALGARGSGAADPGSLGLDNQLLRVLDLGLHLVLLDRELDLALVLQLVEYQVRLLVFGRVEQLANFSHLLPRVHALVQHVYCEGVVYVLLGAVWEFLDALEIENGWLHVVLGLLLLLLLLQLHAH